jgi:N utilization substance protein A
MEVIVDDSQLSLAIGKKGQNVRLAAKLLGWKIDIKSEEEKRQEVESQMEALVSPGAPVSVLADYGLSEAVIENLMEAGVATIEKLGSMTPEQLQEIGGIDPEAVERIQDAVNSYYAQFETAEQATSAEDIAEAGLHIEQALDVPEAEIPGPLLTGEETALDDRIDETLPPEEVPPEAVESEPYYDEGPTLVPAEETESPGEGPEEPILTDSDTIESAGSESHDNPEDTAERKS